MSEPQKQRLDQWLWFARMFKTRTLAATMVKAGKIRVNSERQKKASFMVGPGDVLTFPRANNIMVLEILALGARRGPASEAQTLYRDDSPAPAPKTSRITSTKVAPREAGSGRPTKSQRRALEKLRPDLKA